MQSCPPGSYRPCGPQRHRQDHTAAHPRGPGATIQRTSSPRQGIARRIPGPGGDPGGKPLPVDGNDVRLRVSTRHGSSPSRTRGCHGRSCGCRGCVGGLRTASRPLRVAGRVHLSGPCQARFNGSGLCTGRSGYAAGTPERRAADACLPGAIAPGVARPPSPGRAHQPSRFAGH